MNDPDFYDVTLVCEEDQLIQAKLTDLFSLPEQGT